MPSPPASSPPGAPRPRVDPDRWVAAHGDYLFHFALGRLRSPERAEDALQEAFLAALKSGQGFEGRAAERSWLTGILKHKIYDQFRKASRETSFTDLEFYHDEEAGSFVSGGGEVGAWQPADRPADWPKPGERLDNELLWQAYQECAGKLPKNIAAAFTLRELDGLASKEICEMLGITDSNLWVMLHRARMALRRCLERNWFAKQL